MRTSTLVPLVCVAACAPPNTLVLPPAPSAGQSLAVAQGLILTANPEDDTVVSWREGRALQRTVVGRRPTRVVAAGERAYVSLRGARAVAALRVRGDAVEVIGRVEVGAEPIGLALSADGARLYVAASLSDALAVVDTARLEVIERWPVAGQPRGVALHPSGQRLYVTTQQAGARVVRVRDGLVEPLPLASNAGPGRALVASGDPAVSPDGTSLIVPTLEVDVTTPVVDRYYGDEGATSYVTEVELDPSDGVPLPETIHPELLPLAGVIARVVFTPAGEYALAATDRGELVPLTSLATRRALGGAWPMYRASRPLLVRATAGLVFDEVGRTYAGDGVRRGLSRFDTEHVAEPLDAQGLPAVEGEPLAAWSSGLPPRLERGRLLFSDPTDARVTAGLLTCVSCHVDGRTDGLTWMLGDGRRQTRSLAEGISDHVPLGWRADRPTVADGAHKTIERMGGGGITAEEASDLAAFVDALDRPDIPGRGEETALTRHGREVFGALGCAGCHAGEAYTDRALHALADRPAMSTPSLRGVAITAPYLVDGSVASLEALLDAAPALGKGATDALGADDRAALLAFLRTL